ncbi:hypothetical protein KJ785_03465 [Patescibacteria group bacterium]|nr:hypothetical protein [Patescibacteria group bacterium]
MQAYLLNLATAISLQLLGLFGIFFAFGFVLAKLQEWTQKNYYRSVGWKGILLTAWFGTPIHELGHIFFAKLFHHKINDISFFQPNKINGNLGHVDHSYNKKSPYQNIGNFFIGAAPMIWGSIILVTMLYFLVPNGKEIFAPLANTSDSATTFLFSLKNTFLNLFSLENLQNWNFWVFLYLSFCLSAHIAPSKQDRHGMWKGFVWIVALILLINIITLSFKFDITNYILSLTKYLGIFTAIYTYTLIISLIHFVLSGIILLPLKKM